MEKNLIPLIKAVRAGMYEPGILDSALFARAAVRHFDRKDRMLARRDVDADPEAFDNEVLAYINDDRKRSQERLAGIREIKKQEATERARLARQALRDLDYQPAEQPGTLGSELAQINALNKGKYKVRI